MRGKKGFLLAEETVKIVIALIVIGFLIWFLGSLYYKNKISRELEMATDTLNRLEEEIDAGAESFEVLGPEPGPWGAKGWLLMSFPFKDDPSEIQPDKCSVHGYVNCLCICGVKQFRFPLGLTSLAKTCDNFGVCVEVRNFKIISEREISLGEYTRKNIIKFDKVPFQLKINQEEKIISRE